LQIKNTHSIFFESLKDRGHQLVIREAYEDSASVVFEKYGQFFFDNLILFSPSAEDFGGGMSVEQILSFIDQGGNVIIAASPNCTEPIRELAYEIGLSIDDEGTEVIDHVSYDESDANGLHTLITSTQWIDNKAILGNGSSAPILFKGIGHATVHQSRLFTKVLTGTDNTYSSNPLSSDDLPASIGKQTLLVTAIQTRNNARLVFSGSLDLFSDKFFSLPVKVHSSGSSYSKSGNEAFCKELSKWVFGERGIIRAHSLSHKHQDNNDINPYSYRIMDNIEFSITMEEWCSKKGDWVPFKNDDVQLEFVMLDPYIRTNLKHNGNGKFHARFQVPDVYGVFKFVVEYHRVGYSNLEVQTQVSVRPFRHNEYERFIDVAYPYYLSAGSLMVGFFIFGFVFLYQKSD